jgi:glycosyltransferase involved in cell wall biosynthesis
VVDILLSTYNSEAFLEDLIKSLYSQTYTKWQLLIRDDCSQDSTPTLLKKIKNSDPDRIQIINSDGINLGPKKSFEILLKYSTTDYLMFCDHDDYWLSTKIEVSLNRLLQLEKKHSEKPILVCTDLVVTDDNLNLIHRSFWKHAKINPNNVFNTYKLSINNPVVGCTVMINKKAKPSFLPMPKEAIMHDWWMALKISETGIIDYIKKSTILYRQHSKNKIGIEKVNFNYFVKKIFGFTKTIKENRNVYKMLKTANKKSSFILFIYHKFNIVFSKMIKR